ncbi:MAG: hypothetical protein GF383_06885 [Candidatus Lokiarchaeota archaeon]|nr:hypothetical protein [Candidatus Lokiarchaeota archaeon]MBD3339874.1 hypothetical protein [Candidatus Lokiarchaeota archaeon]
MVWGGSLNEKGSRYIKELMEAEKVVKFLEKFKKEVEEDEVKHFTKVSEIITNYFTNKNQE